MRAESGSAIPFTRSIVESAISLTFPELPGEVQEMSRLCALDWIGVAIAGVHDEVSRIVCDQAIWNGGRGESTIIGRVEMVPAHVAAFVNGTMSHALDFDDVNIAMSGHPTAPLLGAALALAEVQHACGRDLMTALVAGYESECRIGASIAPAHYRMGFHSTATVGSFGAAIASARMLGLDFDLTMIALGIAATQAAGLKSMFGTMCKPFHAGKANENGVVAARLAARGMTSQRDVLECPDGFALTHTSSFDPSAGLGDPPLGFHMLSNLFKYHASCYGTQACIEAVKRLREEHRFEAADVRQVLIRAAPGAKEICCIPSPKTGLELKFSLAGTAALALLDKDTAAVETYSDTIVSDPAFVTLVRGTQVEFVPDLKSTESSVELILADGRCLAGASVVGLPEADLSLLRRKLEAKFMLLVSPHIGLSSARTLMELVNGIDALADVGILTSHLRFALQPSR